MTAEDRKQGGERRRVEAVLRRNLAAAETDGPTSEEVGAYVDGSMEPEDRSTFEELLALDPALRDEVREVRDLRDALHHEASSFRRWAVWSGLAAAAGLAGILAWRASPSVGSGAPPRATLLAPILTLRDAGREITLRADGSVEGLPGLPDEARAAVVIALQGGTLPEPAGLGSLRSRSGTLMGESDASAFRVVTPIATFVRSDRPTFRWTAHPRARAYELSVFSEDLVKIAGARVDAGATKAALPSSLERGRTYLWQVAAFTPDGHVAAPAPPQPEARFRVLGALESDTLESTLAAAPGSDLVAGVLLARAGVRDEAETRLARLAAANPGSPAAGRLLAACRQ